MKPFTVKGKEILAVNFDEHYYVIILGRGNDDISMEVEIHDRYKESHFCPRL
jgi:hypothetical protein